MKAIITAAGAGKRLNGNTTKCNKCLLEVNKKAIIEYSLDTACKFVDEIIIVVGYLHEQIEERYHNNYNNVPIRYVFQKEQKGLVNAIECAKEAVGEEDFMLFLGDEIITHNTNRQMLDAFRERKVFGICGVVEVEDWEKIKATYMVKIEKENIVAAIEKPEQPINNLMGTGNCIFKNAFFRYIEETKISVRFGEKILTDVIESAIKEGEIINWFIIGQNYANINKLSDYENALEWWGE